MSCTFVGLSSSPNTELKTYVRIFEIFAYGLRYRGVSMSLSRHNHKNRSVFRGRIWESGGKILPPFQNLAPFADSEFDVDYDVAIKHDSIKSDD